MTDLILASPEDGLKEIERLEHTPGFTPLPRTVELRLNHSL